jgi:hypothetical protein
MSMLSRPDLSLKVDMSSRPRKHGTRRRKD